MTADSASREDVRNKVADLLDAALVPGLVDRLYRYESDNVETGSKHAAIAVVSGGTKRQASGINDQRWRNVFLVQVLVFVDKANVLVPSLYETLPAMLVGEAFDWFLAKVTRWF